jgi:DNA repair protein RadC
MRLLDLPKTSWPREKARREGLIALSDVELLALIIEKGSHGSNVLDVAASLLSHAGGSFTTLLEMPLSTLCLEKGIADVKALELGAIGEIFRRRAKESLSISSFPDPLDLYQAYAPGLANQKEEILLLLLYTSRGRFLGERYLSRGKEDQVSFDEKVIFRYVLADGAQSFYLLHNHPSGNSLPSYEDQKLTSSLSEKSQSLGLYFVDHLILSATSFYSFRSNRLM